MDSIFEACSPDKLREVVRDLLIIATADERQAFLVALDRTLRGQGIDASRYFVPIGVTASHMGDLNPNEAGHLVRYLKFNKPAVMPSVIETLDILAVKEKTHGKTKPSRVSRGGVSSNRTRVVG